MWNEINESTNLPEVRKTSRFECIVPKSALSSGNKQIKVDLFVAFILFNDFSYSVLNVDSFHNISKNKALYF